MHHREKRYCSTLPFLLRVQYIEWYCPLSIARCCTTLQFQKITKKAPRVSRNCGFQRLFLVGDQSYCKMHGMTVVWEREWMTWGKMARQALQACPQKCELILHCFLPGPRPSFLQVPFFPRKSDVFVAVLVMEHFEKTICARCQRVFVCWMKSLLPLPPRPIT